LAVPADKVDWKPLEEGRSVLDQAREMAQCPIWAIEIITSNEPPKFEGPEMEAQMTLMASWESVEACKKVCDENLAKLAECFQSISDERLKETKWLPFDGGRDFTVAEMMDYPRWNFNYHTGQIAYVQTLYGDKGMH
jgi:hypothetical protein